MSRKHLFLVPLTGLLALLAGWWWLADPGSQTTDDAFIEGHVTPVSARIAGPVVKVLVDDNQEVAAGQLLAEIDQSDYQVRLERAEAGLKILRERSRQASLNVGLLSNTSEAALQLASADLQGSGSSIERAEAAVDTAGRARAGANARVKAARAQWESARQAHRQSEAQIEAARAEAHRTAGEAARYRQLYALDEVTHQQLDNTEAARRASQANLEAAQRRSQAALAQVREAQAGLESARHAMEQAGGNLREAQVHVSESQAQQRASLARLNSAQTAPQQVAVRRGDERILGAEALQAQANLREARLNLSYTRILAPCAGRVTRKSVETGAYLQPGQPLLSLVSSDVWVVANFKEAQITRMRAGQSVEVKVDAFPQLHLRGRVDSLQAGSGARYALLPPENASGNHVKVAQRIPVKITFEEQPETLKQLGPGMSVVPTVQLR